MWADSPSQGIDVNISLMSAILYSHDPKNKDEKATIKADLFDSTRPIILSQRFCGDTISKPATIADKAVKTNKTVPRGWFKKASNNRKSAIKENVVVIPQSGHGRCNTAMEMHGSRPSWVCVPTPDGSGTNHRATDNTATVTTKTVVEIIRAARGLTLPLLQEGLPRSLQRPMRHLDLIRRADWQPAPSVAEVHWPS